MHLGLNGWPPVASHVAAVLFGVSVAHLAWTEEPSLRLPERTLALSLPPALLRRAETSAGAHLHLVQTRAGASPCRLTRTPVTLLARLPAPVVSMALGDTPDLGAME